MGLLGLACIFSTIVMIDGPLLQRASSAVSAPYNNNAVTLNFSMVPEIPRDYTGQWQVSPPEGIEVFPNRKVPLPGGGTAPADIFPGILPGPTTVSQLAVINKWYNNESLSGIVSGCPGTCAAKLVAPALAVTSCSSPIHDVDYYQTALRKAFNFTKYPSVDAIPLLLESILVVDDGPKEKIQIATSYATVGPDCKGTYNLTVCLLESAIGEYGVTVSADTITIDSALNPRILAIANNSQVNRTYVDKLGWQPSTLGGIIQQVSERWQVYSWYSLLNGTLQAWQVGTTQTTLFQAPGQSATAQCTSFKSPLDFMIAEFNKLMIYYGEAAAKDTASPYILSNTPYDPGMQINTTSTGYRIGNHEVFSTNYYHFLGAALAQLICVCLVVPTYWGWWKLGRDVSFSPLEVAKAFEAPILADVNSNSSGRDIARACEGRSVRYGGASAGGEKWKLTLADSNDVTTPQSGTLFDV